MTRREAPLYKADSSYLLNAALSHQSAGNYRQALECFSSLIETAEPNDFYYYLRASTYSDMYQFDRAAADLKYALQLNTDAAEYYYLLGGDLLSHELTVHGRINVQTSHAVLNEIVDCYVKSLEKDPTCQPAWLDLLEVNVLMRKWDDAVAWYGSSRPYITRPGFALIRAFLGCLAIALAGDAITAEDEHYLYDANLVISVDSYRFGEIESLLRELQQVGYDGTRLSLAANIYDLFLTHFHEPLKNDYACLVK